MPTDTELLVLWKANAEAWKVAALAQSELAGLEAFQADTRRAKEKVAIVMSQAWVADKTVRGIEADWPKSGGEPNA